MKLVSFVTIFLLLSFDAHSAFYKYSELQLLDYSEMLSMVRERTQKANDALIRGQNKEADEEGERIATEELRDTLKLILSRPNRGNMVAKLMPNVRRPLENLSAYHDTMASLVNESIHGINQKSLDLIYRSTYVYVLENAMSELRPEIKDKPIVKKIFEKIRDAKIVIPKDIKKERKMRNMENAKSPSETAKIILSKAFPNEK